MRISPSRAGAISLVALLLAGVGVPALGQQQERPESLLPPGFDEPAPAPAPRPSAAPAPAPAPAASPTMGNTEVGGTIDIPAGNESTAEPTPEPVSLDFSRYDLPDIAKHGLNRVGGTAWGNPAFPARAFGHADGRFLSVLMRRLDAPVASRWVSIALRRALMSRVNTPRNVNGADFAAERAWLLVRMGEPVAARAVIQDVDNDNYSIKLYQMAMQVALATADPGALCGIADPGSKLLPHRGWQYARAMCAGLAGDPTRAGQLLDAARPGPGDFDALLAEKVLGTGAQGRRAVTIEWQGAGHLSAWRWGLATATGEDIPDALYGTVGPQVRYWQALAPAVDPIRRAAAAELAAAQGVFSNEGLVGLYAQIEEGGESAASAEVAVARDLRTASSDPQQDNRVTALHTLWSEATSARRQYARLVLTARAAAGIVPGSNRKADADTIVSSILTTGYVDKAMAWRTVAQRGSDAWMMLALADPAAAGAVSSGDFDAYRNSAGDRKAQMALAGLAGLGRLDAGTARGEASALDVAIGAANRWTRAIDAAGRSGDAGSVALLAAVGMQSRGWGNVKPEALFHIVAAFRAAGYGHYARLIAVEAIARS